MVQLDKLQKSQPRKVTEVVGSLKYNTMPSLQQTRPLRNVVLLLHNTVSNNNWDGNTLNLQAAAAAATITHPRRECHVKSESLHSVAALAITPSGSKGCRAVRSGQVWVAAPIQAAVVTITHLRKVH